MKKIGITTLLFFVLVVTTKNTFSQNANDPFCMNRLQGEQLEIADMYFIYTQNLLDNPVLGQFYKCGYSSLEENSLTMPEIERFLQLYSNKFRFGSGNYFLIKQNNSFFILSINRTKEKLFFQLKSLDEVIHQKDFIYIMIPKKAGA